jgi:DegV family protein with EDD domain
VDVDSAGFYRLLAATNSFPTTSQPSVGDILSVYRQAAAVEPEVLAIHVESLLSGTYSAAVAASQMVPGADISVYDSRCVSAPVGWMVEAACRCAQAGWDKQRIIALLERIRVGAGTVFTTPSLRYLIHGGRISHLKGFLATALGIKPVIAIDGASGAVQQAGQARTLRSAYESRRRR